VADAQAKGRAESAQLMSQAEQRAAEHLSQIIRETEGSCDELRAQAQSRLEQAADLIVRRVVDA
jgi:V/A-type H+-transporting ATPase subunit G/H